MMEEENLDDIRRIRKGFTLEGTSPKAALLVHGIGGNAAGVYRIANYLNQEKGVTTVGLCLKGHAGEPKDLKKVRFQDWLNQTEEAYLALSKKYQDVTLIGNSLGSLVVMALAEKYPSAKLVLISCPLFYSHPVFYLAKPISLFGIYHVWHGFTGMSKERAELVCYSKIPYKSVSELNRLQSYCRKGIGSLTTPFTAYFGGKDPLINVEKSKAFLAEKTPKGKLVDFPEDGHGLLFAPDAEQLFASIASLF